MPFPNRLVTTLTGHTGPVHCVQFSAGAGQYILTGSSDRTVRLSNPSKSSLVQTYSAHGYEVLDLALTPSNERFASVGGDKTVFLWDVSTARTLRRWTGHFGRINCVSFGGTGGGGGGGGGGAPSNSNDGSVVISGSFDATVRIWDTKSQSSKPIQILSEATDSVSAVLVSAISSSSSSSSALGGHEIITGSVDGRVRTYDLRMGMLHTDLIGHPITSLSQTGDGNALLVSTLDGTIRLIDKGNGQSLQSYKGHANTEYRIRSCLGMGDGVVVSGSEDGAVYAWDLLEGNVVEKMNAAHGGKVVSAVAWNGAFGKKEWASTGGDGKVCIWSMPR